MADKKISDMSIVAGVDINWDEDVAPVVSANESVLSQKNKAVLLKTLRPQPLDTGDTPNFAGILLNGVPIAEALGIHTAKDNLNAAEEPTVNDDETEGYSVGSRWYDTGATPAVYVCLDATEGAAVWVESSVSVEDLGTAAVKNIGTTGDTVPVLNARNHHKHVGYSIASTGSSEVIDWSLGDYHTREISDDIVFEFANVPTSGPSVLYLKVQTVGTPTIDFTFSGPFCVQELPEVLAENACHIFQVHTTDGTSLEIAANWNLVKREPPPPPPPSDGTLILKVPPANLATYGPLVGQTIVNNAFTAQSLSTHVTTNTGGNIYVLGMKSVGQPVAAALTGASNTISFYPFTSSGFLDRYPTTVAATALTNSVGRLSTVIAWNPAGTQLAVITATRTITVYSWSDVSGLGAQIATYTWPVGDGPGTGVSLAWSPNGNNIAVYGAGPTGNPLPSTYRRTIIILPWTGSSFGSAIFPPSGVGIWDGRSNQIVLYSCQWIDDNRLLVCRNIGSSNSTTTAGILFFNGSAFTGISNLRTDATGGIGISNPASAVMNDARTKLVAAQYHNASSTLAIIGFNDETNEFYPIYATTEGLDSDDRYLSILGFVPGSEDVFVVGTETAIRLRHYNAVTNSFEDLDSISFPGTPKTAQWYIPPPEEEA